MSVVIAARVTERDAEQFSREATRRGISTSRALGALVRGWCEVEREAEQYRQQHRALGESLAASDATKRLKAGAGSKRPIATSVIMGNPARGLYEMNLPGDAG